MQNKKLLLGGVELKLKLIGESPKLQFDLNTEPSSSIFLNTPLSKQPKHCGDLIY